MILPLLYIDSKDHHHYHQKIERSISFAEEDKWWSSIKASEVGSEWPTTHLVPQVQREAWAGRQMMNTETQVTWSGTGTGILQASASLPGHYLWSPFLFWSPITIRWEHSARLSPILLRWGIRTMSLMPTGCISSTQHSRCHKGLNPDLLDNDFSHLCSIQGF